MFFRAEGLVSRISQTGRFLLGLAGILAGLLVVGLAWWWFPTPPPLLQEPELGCCHKILISDDGKGLLAAHRYGLVLWDIIEQKVKERWPFAWVYGNPDKCWLSADGQVVVYVDERTEPRQAWLWREFTAVTLPLANCHGFVHDLPSTCPYIIGSEKGRYRVWRVATGDEVASNGPGFATIIKYYPDGRVLASEVGNKGWEWPVRIWNLIGPDAPLDLEGCAWPAVVSPDGRMVAASTKGMQSVKLWDLARRRIVASIEIADGRKWAPDVFSLGGDELLISSWPEPNELFSPRDWQIWNVAETPPRELARIERAMPLGMTPDGKWAYALEGMEPGGAGDYKMSIWSTTTWKSAGSLICTWRPFPKFTPDGSAFFSQLRRKSSSSENELITGLWTVPHGQELARLDVSNVETCAFFQEGKAIAIGREDGDVEVWDIEDTLARRRAILSLRKHQESPPCRHFLIEYGLPVLFGMLLLAGIWHIRQFRKCSPTVPAVADRCNAPSDAAVR